MTGKYDLELPARQNKGLPIQPQCRQHQLLPLTRFISDFFSNLAKHNTHMTEAILIF